MKKLIILLVLLVSKNFYSQILDPISWKTSVEKITTTEYNLITTATIDSGWHLYSQNVPKDGPIPTTFSFEKSNDFKLLGTPTEEEGKTVNDQVFNMKIKYFEKNTIFKQRIKVSNPNTFNVTGELEFMVCNDENCLPPTFVDLKFVIPAQNDLKKKTVKLKRNKD